MRPVVASEKVTGTIGRNGYGDRMTTPAAEQESVATKRKPRRVVMIAAVALAVMACGLAYGNRFGQCDLDSSFCAFGIAGTRSEVVVAWLDGPDIFMQTYPG